MAKLDPEAALNQFAAWLERLLAARLRSLIAYGSYTGGNHHGEHSDINLLCVLDRVDGATLDQVAEALRWWTGQGRAPVVLLSEAELRDAADVFPIEYLDIQRNHRLLKGEDLVASLPHDPRLHRLQVERELRAKLVKLRAGYVGRQKDGKAIEALLLESFSTFVTLFRHALAAVGEPLLLAKEEVIAAAARRFDFAAEPFQAVLNARREARRLPRDLAAIRPIFAGYHDAIQRVERALEAHGA